MHQKKVLKQFKILLKYCSEDDINDIMSKENLKTIYGTWKKEQQEKFLDICTGVQGFKILYDGYFKEIFDPDSKPEPQKNYYRYSADLLLRQYKRVKGEKGKKFSYKNIKKVYSIIFYEQSPKEFHSFPNHNIHRSKQQTDTGVEIELLQEFLFIPLDIVKNIYENSRIRNKLDAWLIFLSDDNPETILKLVEEYPEFRKMYDEVYNLCLNTEKVMEMFSEELRELDRNTVQLMIDEMGTQLTKKEAQIAELERQIQELTAQKQYTKTGITPRSYAGLFHF